MPTLIKTLLCSLLFSFLLNSTDAEVRLPSIISDHMVLQQFSWVSLWGQADPGETVTIVTSWDQKTHSIQADAGGKWKLRVFTTGPGGPYMISFTGKNRLQVKDVMIGEVWVCGGQSNMEFSFYDLGGWKYFTRLKQTITSSDLGRMRICTVSRKISNTPLDSCGAAWLQADSVSALYTSATAFCFGLELYRKFNIPVGIIVSSWSGTPAEAWTPDEYLRYSPKLTYYLKHPNSPGSEATAPSVLFNGMIFPIRHYTIRGFIWYQGESNRYDADLYASLFRSMITSWRKYWEQYDLPFYFVQIAPYDYGDYEDASGYLREAQAKTLTLENTGMAVTLDIGNLSDIHPKNKEEVGRRLANLAFTNTYGISGLSSSSGPEYWFSKPEGIGIQVYFKNAGLLTSNGKNLSGFRIAAKEGVFSPAEAVVMGKSVMVSSKDVPSPVYVRYAFKNTDTASLFEVGGLPAGSFRTDSLKFNYREVFVGVSFNRAKKNWKVWMNCPDDSVVIRYTTDGNTPGITSARYSDTLNLDTSVKLRVLAFSEGMASGASAGIDLVKHEGLGSRIVLEKQPSDKYKGNEYSLCDGIQGSTQFRDGRWLGFLSDDLRASIDLGTEKHISNITISFLVNTSSYIFPPVEVVILTSPDGRVFRKSADFKPLPPGKSSMTKQPEIIRFSTANISGMVRYIKIVAKNKRTNPPWHSAPGEKCWLFVDEVECR